MKREKKKCEFEIELGKQTALKEKKKTLKFQIFLGKQSLLSNCKLEDDTKSINGFNYKYSWQNKGEGPK